MSLLSLQHVTHHFAGLRAVSDFNLQLEAGELVALIGPNGAGKTTIFNLISGVYRASAGSIAFAEHSLLGRYPHQIVRLGLARTFQNIRLFRDLSALDNVRIACDGHSHTSILQSLLRLPGYVRGERETMARSLELLAAFGLADLAAAPAGSLPYGQQRRLEMARALATQPRLLLLDEPAAGMNPAEAHELMNLILWMRREFHLTILLIEHQMQVVMGAAERVLVLDFGETIAEGTPVEIQGNDRVIEAYLGEEAD
ncbi:ABC transporter ATP-binding protein [bacterium]|nr:ABC transporter ATP-binding protein [bacterium]